MKRSLLEAANGSVHGARMRINVELLLAPAKKSPSRTMSGVSSVGEK